MLPNHNFLVNLLIILPLNLPFPSINFVKAGYLNCQECFGVMGLSTEGYWVEPLGVNCFKSNPPSDPNDLQDLARDNVGPADPFIQYCVTVRGQVYINYDYNSQSEAKPAYALNFIGRASLTLKNNPSVRDLNGVCWTDQPDGVKLIDPLLTSWYDTIESFQMEGKNWKGIFKERKHLQICYCQKSDGCIGKKFYYKEGAGEVTESECQLRDLTLVVTFLSAFLLGGLVGVAYHTKRVQRSNRFKRDME